jgi:hypothetical protein
MEKNLLLKLIEKTCLLSPVDKSYFLNRVPSYPPAMVRQMIQIIHRHENHLLRVSQDRLLEIQAENSVKLRDQFLTVKKEHETERRTAEKELEKSLLELA